MDNKIHKIRGWDRKINVWVYGVSPWCYEEENKSHLNMVAFWSRVNSGTISSESVSQYAGYSDSEGREVYVGDRISYNVRVQGHDGPMLTDKVNVSFHRNALAVNIKVVSE